MSRAAKITEQAMHDADWLRENLAHEIRRVQGILRDDQATDTDRAVAKMQLEHYQTGGR